MTKFTITNDHVKLIRAACIGRNESNEGSWGMDSAYPYGVGVDYTLFAGIAKALGEPYDSESGMSSDQKDRYLKLHSEMGYVLDIMFQQSFIPIGEWTFDEKALIEETGGNWVREWDEESEFGVKLRKDLTIYTIEEFQKNCVEGGFIDYDGVGTYVKDGIGHPACRAIPSEIAQGIIDHRFTHVEWSNR
jgi:hypothetical protein